MKPFFMQRPFNLAAAGIGLLLLVFFAGCTSPTDSLMKAPVTPTPLPTAVPTSEAPVPTTPVAVNTLPPEQSVDVAVTKERPDASIHLLYNGGKGEMFVQSIMMRVTTSDGKITEQYLNDNTRKPRRGDELVMQGTRGSDRVQVYLASAGKMYQLIDESVISMQ